MSTYIDVWSKTLNSEAGYAIKRNYRNVLAAANISQSGSKVRIRIDAHSTQALTVTGVSIGERVGSTIAFNGAPTRLTFGGNNDVTVAAGVPVYSDSVVFALDESKDYLVHLALVTGAYQYVKRMFSGGDGCYYKETTDDDTMVENPSGYTLSAGYNYCVNLLQKVLDVVTTVIDDLEIKTELDHIVGEIGGVISYSMFLVL